MKEQIMLTSLSIKKVRHLHDIRICICRDDENKIRHLLLTGKNGSGKTSLLEALATYLRNISRDKDFFKKYVHLENDKKSLGRQTNPDSAKETRDRVDYWKKVIEKNEAGISAEFNCNPNELFDDFAEGKFVLAFFKDNRVFEADVSEHVEKTTLKNQYSIEEEPRKIFIKYLVDKKVSQSLYQTKNDTEKADKLQKWFDSFENLLKEIYEDPTLQLDFDVDSFQFKIRASNRESFDFNTMSAGYAAVLDIVVGIIMRMESHNKGKFQFDMPGIVLIDELETHLHYELQKKALPFLCRVFPNIQFVVTTHSAFVLNSIGNVVIYDLENQTLVKDGLQDIPYDGIIKGYFGASVLSEELKEKFERYKSLVKQATISDDDLAEISRLELYLDEIPDYLALELTTEYQRLKVEFEGREDLK